MTIRGIGQKYVSLQSRRKAGAPAPWGTGSRPSCSGPYSEVLGLGWCIVPSKVPLQLRTWLERVMIWYSSGMAVSRGAVVNPCRPFILRVVILTLHLEPVNTFVPECGVTKVSLSPSAVSTCCKWIQEATLRAVMWPIGNLFPCLMLAQTVSEGASKALEKHMCLKTLTGRVCKLS